MIIKRREAEHFGTRREPRPVSASGDGGTLAHEAPPVAWSQENVDAGLVAERRKGDERIDRRRGYRRVEEKHLISRAHEEANAIRENAQREGFEAGLIEAHAEIERLRETIADLMSGRDEVLAEMVGEIAPLAVEVASRVIKTEVSCDETLVMALVRDTIQKAGRNTKTILVRLHPDDINLVRGTLKDKPIQNLQAELVLMDDPTVDAGSCIVETNGGLIDATFSTQLGVLRQLFGHYEPRREPGDDAADDHKPPRGDGGYA